MIQSRDILQFIKNRDHMLSDLKKTNILYHHGNIIGILCFMKYIRNVICVVYITDVLVSEFKFICLDIYTDSMYNFSIFYITISTNGEYQSLGVIIYRNTGQL